MAMLGEKELATWRRPEFAGPRRNVVFNKTIAGKTKNSVVENFVPKCL